MKNISKSLQEIENIESLLDSWLKANAPKDSAWNIVSLVVGAGPREYYKKEFLAVTACPADISQRILRYIQTYEVSLYLKTIFHVLLNKTGYLSLEVALMFVKMQKTNIKKLSELKVALQQSMSGVNQELSQATQSPVTKVIDAGLKLLSKKI